MKLNVDATLPSGETATTEEPISLESDDDPFSDQGATLSTPPDFDPIDLINADGLNFGQLASVPRIEWNEVMLPTPTGPQEDCTEGATCPGIEPPPAGDILDITIAVGCDHRIPNVESDVIVKVQNMLPGQTARGTVSGPGVIGDGTFSATAGEDGTAEARVPINQFGSYEAKVTNVSGTDEFGDYDTPVDDLGIDGTHNVGEVCTPP